MAKKRKDGDKPQGSEEKKSSSTINKDEKPVEKKPVDVEEETTARDSANEEENEPTDEAEEEVKTDKNKSTSKDRDTGERLKSEQKPSSQRIKHASVDSEDAIFELRERDDMTAGMLFAGACAMVVISAYFLLRDTSNMFMWLAIMFGSGLPLFGLGAYFLRATVVALTDSGITKKPRSGKHVFIPWNEVYGVSIEQGVPGDMSVCSIALWLHAEDGHEHIAFVTTEEIGLAGFSNLGYALKDVCGERGLAFEDRDVVLKKIS